jgi:hypothetical protein
MHFPYTIIYDAHGDKPINHLCQRYYDALNEFTDTFDDVNLTKFYTEQLSITELISFYEHHVNMVGEDKDILVLKPVYIAAKTYMIAKTESLESAMLYKLSQE